MQLQRRGNKFSQASLYFFRISLFLFAVTINNFYCLLYFIKFYHICKCTSTSRKFNFNKQLNPSTETSSSAYFRRSLLECKNNSVETFFYVISKNTVMFRTTWYQLITSLAFSDLLSALISPLYMYGMTWGFVVWKWSSLLCKVNKIIIIKLVYLN